MNTQNVASLEACKRLVDAGIVLETDFYWYVYNEDMCRSLIAADKAIPAPYLVNRASVRTRIGSIPTAYVPAPSMAEVWRELPETIDEYDLTCEKIFNGGMQAGYTTYDVSGLRWKVLLNAANPTDAMIDLLILVIHENDAWQRIF
jgi:hypothetical protein